MFFNLQVALPRCKWFVKVEGPQKSTFFGSLPNPRQLFAWEKVMSTDKPAKNARKMT